MSDSVSFAFRAGKCLLLCNTDTHIGASHAGSDSPFLRKGSVMKGTENSAKRCIWQLASLCNWSSGKCASNCPLHFQQKSRDKKDRTSAFATKLKNAGTKKIALLFWYILSLCYAGVTPSQILTCEANLCAGLFILSHFCSEKKCTENVTMMTSVLEVLYFLLFHSKLFWIRLGLDQGRGWTLCCYIFSMDQKTLKKFS